MLFRFFKLFPIGCIGLKDSPNAKTVDEGYTEVTVTTSD